MTVPDTVADDSELNRAERAFVQAVLACHGMHQLPTEAEFRRAMKVMVAYAQQVEDNPPEGVPSLSDQSGCGSVCVVRRD